MDLLLFWIHNILIFSDLEESDKIGCMTFVIAIFKFWFIYGEQRAFWLFLLNLFFILRNVKEN